MTDLSKEEIDKLIQKIRSEYSILSKENPEVFSVYPFEKRYTEILINRGNIQRFLRDEIVFLDLIKTKYLAKKEKQKSQEEQPTINKIMQKQMERVQKYPMVDFHPMAKIEIKHFYGAIIDFSENDIQLLYKIFKGLQEMNEIIEHIYLIEKVGLARKGKLSIRMTEHISVLQDNRTNTSAIERECQLLLKETCKSLKILADQLHECLIHRKVKSTTIVGFSEIEPKELRERFANQTYQQIIENTIKKAHEIIVDFRMDSIVGLEVAKE
jgi:hypothetical protein